MKRLFIVSKFHEELSGKKDDYKYFYWEDDMIKFMNKNDDQYIIRNDLPNLHYDFFSLLGEAEEISHDINNLRRVKFMNEYIGKHIYLNNPSEPHRLSFGFVHAVYFPSMLKISCDNLYEQDYMQRIDGINLDCIEIVDIQKMGMYSFGFGKYNFDLSEIKDDSELVEKKIKRTSRYKLIDESDKIYFIRDIEAKAIKIGVSKNVKSRMSQLQTSTPNKLELIKTINGSYDREKKIHEKFKDYRLSGEWFQDNEILTEYIIKVK